MCLCLCLCFFLCVCLCLCLCRCLCRFTCSVINTYNVHTCIFFHTLTRVSYQTALQRATLANWSHGVTVQYRHRCAAVAAARHMTSLFGRRRTFVAWLWRASVRCVAVYVAVYVAVCVAVCVALACFGAL